MADISEDSVEYKLLLNAQQALKELQEFNRGVIKSDGVVDSLSKRINNFERVVQNMASATQTSVNEVLLSFEKLDTKLRSQKKMGVFGDTEGTNPFDVVRERMARREADNAAYLKKLKIDRDASEGLIEYNQAMLQGIDLNEVAANSSKKVGSAMEETGKKAKTSSEMTVGGINIVRVALYTLVSAGIFAVINAFQQLFSMAIKGLREMETATYNLVNAERNLSKEGVDITPKGLEETIAGLQKLDPLLSKIEASELVSRVAANVAPQVGFGAGEIKQLSESIAILAVKNKGLGKSFEEVESQVTNAFLTGKVSQAINSLGVKITDQIVKDEALRLGLVKTAKDFDNLTGKMEANIKARAMLSVLSQVTDKERAYLPEYLKTADAQFGIFQARLQDVLTLVGKDLGPLIGKFFEVATNALSITLFILEKMEPAIQQIVSLIVAFVSAKKGQGLFGFDKNAFDKSYEETMKSFEGLGGAQDTATEQQKQREEQQRQREESLKKHQDKLVEIMKEGNDKLVDLARDYQQKLEDISRDTARKLADIDIQTAQKREDAQRDYNDKVADINKDYADKVQEARKEYQRNEAEKEKQHQDRMKELREKYLMDLEDALRARDARAVLRLMRQYQIDKNKAIQDRARERQEAKVALAQKLQDLEAERQQKLADAQKDLADKLRDIKINYDRERAEAIRAASRARADARLNYNRQLEDQRIFLQRKLRDLAAALMAEFNMSKAQAEALIKMWQSSYNKIGSITGTSSGTSGTTSTTSSAATNAYGNASSPASVNAGTYNPGGLAEGGSFLATTPTTLRIAENRPEMITATPLGKPGRDVNKLFLGSGVGGGGVGGQIEIGLTLSPDLESRIVRNTLDKTAEVVLKVNRSKV